MKSIVKLDAPLVSPPSNFKGDFFKGTNISAASHRFTYSIFLFFFKFIFLICDSVSLLCRNPEWFNRCWPH